MWDSLFILNFFSVRRGFDGVLWVYGGDSGSALARRIDAVLLMFSTNTSVRLPGCAVYSGSGLGMRSEGKSNTDGGGGTNLGGGGGGGGGTNTGRG